MAAGSAHQTNIIITSKSSAEFLHEFEIHLLPDSVAKSNFVSVLASQNLSICTFGSLYPLPISSHVPSARTLQNPLELKPD